MASISRPAAACSAAAALLLLALPAGAAEQITFVSQGGAYQKAQTVAILDPAAKNQHHHQPGQRARRGADASQVAGGKPIWDVVDVATGFCLRGGSRASSKLDFSSCPTRRPCRRVSQPWSVAYEFYSSVLAYGQALPGRGVAPRPGPTSGT
jgi:putative spermidine/putrescine transport system substrate-binding protein